MEYFYTVFQIWFDANGNPGVQGFVFREQEGQLPAVNRALSKYHDILRIGSVSADLYHAAMCIRSDGQIIKPWEYYDRRPVLPEE